VPISCHAAGQDSINQGHIARLTVDWLGVEHLVERQATHNWVCLAFCIMTNAWAELMAQGESATLAALS